MGEYWDGMTESFVIIPTAMCYVLSNDKCMSGWGKSTGKTNTAVVPCSSQEMAAAVESYVQSREEQKYVRIVSNKPRSKKHILYSLCLGWIERAREFSTLRREYIDW